MANAELIETGWDGTVERLGGRALLEAEARERKAFERPREIANAVDLLRLALAYCLGSMGLRLTAAWAETIGAGRLSNVALLGRLRNCVAWLESIVARLLAEQAASRASRQATDGPGAGRLIRLVDATTVRKAGKAARESGRLWRIHAVFDLPAERFSAFELTDESEAEAIDRVAVVPGEIRIADRVHCRADGLAGVIEAGADVVVRASWRSARWCDATGAAVDIIGVLRDNATGSIDMPIGLCRASGQPLVLRLIAVRLPKDKAVKAVAEARAEAKSKQRDIQAGTLAAAEWTILVTSLRASEYSGEQVLDLYRLRWRIEIAFKRMKSLAGLSGPPGACPRLAKVWVLSHLIAVLLTEAALPAVGASPRSAHAPALACGAPSVC